MTQGLIHQEDLKVINTYAPHNRVSKYIKNYKEKSINPWLYFKISNISIIGEVKKNSKDKEV